MMKFEKFTGAGDGGGKRAHLKEGSRAWCAVKGGGVARQVRRPSIGSWSAAVVLATGAAACTMVATAAVSVLTEERVAEAGELYGPPTPSSSLSPPKPWRGNRAVRALTADAPNEPAPVADACVVRYVPLVENPYWGLRGLVPAARPMHEAVEVPENFI